MANLAGYQNTLSQLGQAGASRTIGFNDISDAWYNQGGGIETNAAPWTDTSKPNEKQQFDSLWDTYKGVYGNWATNNPDLAKQYQTPDWTQGSADYNRALSAPMQYNPSLVGKGGGFFGSDIGQIVKLAGLGAGAAFLGPEVFGALGGEGAAALGGEALGGYGGLEAFGAAGSMAGAAGGAGALTEAGLGSLAGGIGGDSVAGSGFLSDLPAWAGGAGEAGGSALAGDIAGGGGFASSISDGLGQFGLDSLGANGLSSGFADPWASQNPFGDLGGNSNPFQFNSSSQPYNMGPNNAAQGPSPAGGPKSLSDMVSNYFSQPKNLFDVGRAGLNYFQNQNLADQAQKLGQNAANNLNDPRRQPFIDEATRIAQGNLGQGGDALKTAVMQAAAARQGKYGYSGTENSKADVALEAALAGFGNDRLNALLGYTGMNQNNAVTSYMSARDSLAFKTQSYQGFTALAAKIGASALGDGAGAKAQEIGQSILKMFS